jgi:hypothetical protein
LTLPRLEPGAARSTSFTPLRPIGDEPYGCNVGIIVVGSRDLVVTGDVEAAAVLVVGFTVVVRI